jgi:formate dehydrogenase iron-sulfur subunit
MEVPGQNDQKWLFVGQRCMHCEEAGCMEICPASGALFKTKEGAVDFNKQKCIGCRLCIAGCPFNIPRYDENDKISKCHLCSDRIANSLAPACAKTCPTGAISFGDRDELITKAKKRGFRSLYGETDLGGLGIIYAFREPPAYYGFPQSPRLPLTVIVWKNILKPLALIGFGGAVAAAGLLRSTISLLDQKMKEEEMNNEDGREGNKGGEDKSLDIDVELLYSHAYRYRVPLPLF